MGLLGSIAWSRPRLHLPGAPAWGARNGPVFSDAGELSGWETPVREWIDRPLPLDMGQFAFDAEMLCVWEGTTGVRSLEEFLCGK